jgi:hypothetical protein
LVEIPHYERIEMRKVHIIFKGLLWVLVFLSVISQASYVKASGPDDDSLEDNAYTNNYFSFQLPIPDDWYIADDQTIQNLRQAAENYTAGNLGKIDYLLLMVSQLPAGTSGDSNPSLSIAAESLSRFAKVNNGQEYLSQLSGTLARYAIYTVGKVYEYPLDGIPFYRLDLEVSTEIGQIRQSYIAMASKEYVLSIVLTGRTEEEISRLENIIASGAYESMSTEVDSSIKRPVASLQGLLGVGLMLGAVVLMIMDQWLKRRKVKKTESTNAVKDKQASGGEQ